VDKNDTFKQKVRSELDGLQSMIHEQKKLLTSFTSSSINNKTPDPISVLPESVQSLVRILPVNSNHVSPTSTDQVLLMLTDSFSKMASALTDKNVESKAEWLKFSGDHKKFRSWYLALVTQLSIAPWTELYDSFKNDVVSMTTNTTLNGKLYSKLILALEGLALQHVVSQKHLRANGLLVLQDLVHAYKPKNIPEVIAAKTTEFWGSMKRSPTESLDAYYNRFQELLDDLVEADEPISTKSAIRHFLFTLEPEFESIQNNDRIANLPDAWKTQDWTTILVLCRDYYNSVKPNFSECKNLSSENNFYREAHQKKVREWFLNPVKFNKVIENEQHHHPNRCIYHLSKTHPTHDCAVKKDCDQILDT